MCWNESISWTTFVLGSILNGVCAYFTKDSNILYLYVLFQVVITVQLGEALIWKGASTAQLGTWIAFLSVWLQPFVAVLILHQWQASTYVQFLFFAMLVVYVVFSLSTLASVGSNTYHPELCLLDGKTHINFDAWKRSFGMSFLYLMIVLGFLGVTLSKYPLVSGYVLVTYMLSMLLYGRLFSSMWCWFAVISPLFCWLSTQVPAWKIPLIPNVFPLVSNIIT